MSIKEELAKVLQATSMAVPAGDQEAFLAPLMAELDAMEKNVAALLAHPAVAVPAIEVAVPVVAPVAPAAVVEDQAPAPAADAAAEPAAPVADAPAANPTGAE